MSWNEWMAGERQGHFESPRVTLHPWWLLIRPRTGGADMETPGKVFLPTLKSQIYLIIFQAPLPSPFPKSQILRVA